MKSMIALVIGMFLSFPALADKVVMNFSHLSGSLTTAEGVERITVSVEDDGKLKISGSLMTEIVEEPVVIKDDRPLDGSLYLKVGAAELEVGSSFTIHGTVSYTLKLAGETVQLQPVVYFNIVK